MCSCAKQGFKIFSSLKTVELWNLGEVRGYCTNIWIVSKCDNFWLIIWKYYFFFFSNYFNSFSYHLFFFFFQQIDYLVSQYNTTKDKALSDLNSKYFDLEGVSDVLFI